MMLPVGVLELSESPKESTTNNAATTAAPNSLIVISKRLKIII